jgi:hypothetical protein
MPHDIAAFARLDAMKQFMSYKQKRAAHLNSHPFVDWLDTDNVDIARKFDFMPVMTLFIMGFRDMNLWVIRFDDQPDEHFREIINGNTREDETHSRLFLEDWTKLDIDRKLGWAASDTLWWLFVSPDTECYRRYQVEFVKLTIDDAGDPMLRFAHSEAGEACGHVFFRHSVGPAAALSACTGIDYRYFGQYHLDRELGHVMESEGEFEDQVLLPEQRAAALGLGERMFDIFQGIFDSFKDYVDRYVETDTVPKVQSYEPPPRKPHEALEVVTPEQLQQPSFAANRLEKLLADRKRAAERHPFYTWLRANPELTAADKLRRFIPLWVMDIMGYRDLNHYVFYYDDPQDPLARRINAWVTDLETHSMLFLADWAALGMDERLGWSARETLEFCFLDPSMDVHRKNIFAFMKLGLRNPEPVLRFWLMHALEASGEAFFATTRELARAAEAEGIGPLDYLGDRHEQAHPDPRRSAAELRETFLREPLTLAQIEIAERMINVVFDALDEQLDLSLIAAEINRFAIPDMQKAQRAANS